MGKRKRETQKKKRRLHAMPLGMGSKSTATLSAEWSLLPTWGDLVREYFPDASDEEVGFILWEKTGFPVFWNIPQDGDTAEACCRKQLAALKDEVG